MSDKLRAWSKLGSLLLIVLLGAANALPAFAEEVHRFDISSRDAAAAIQQFGMQSGVQILAAAEGLQERRLNSVTGDFSTERALQLLLAGSGLTHRYIGERAVALVVPDDAEAASGQEEQTGATASDEAQGPAPAAPVASPSSRDAAGEANEPASSPSANRTELEEIVVTGTHLRTNANIASPLYTYDREDIARTGATNVQQLLETIPQNLRDSGFGGSPDGAFGGGPFKRVNTSQAAGANLRGLGAGSTLTLVNGKRLAASAGGTVVDLNLIPLSAIERVDILADGGSAVYGADAVGGVVNIILRRRYDGVEGRAEYKTDDSNDYSERRGGITFGVNGDRFHGLVAGNVGAATELLASDRDFTNLPVVIDPSGITRESMLYPETSDKSLFATAGFDFSPATTFNFDLLYGDRSSDQVRTDRLLRTSVSQSTTKQLSARAGLTSDFSSGWSVDVNGGYFRTKIPDRQQTLSTASPFAAANDYLNRGFDAQGIVRGTWRLLAEHPIAMATGVEYRNEDYDTAFNQMVPARPAGLATQTRSLERATSSAFVEMSAPLLSGDDSTHSGDLILTLAGRYDHYEQSTTSTGNARTDTTDNTYDAVNPQIGLVWRPTSWLKLRGNYNTAFKPASPFFVTLGGVNNILTSLDANSPTGGTSRVLILSGTSTDLKPEESRNMSAGIDIAPWGGSWSSSLTYFRYKYRDRVDDPSAALSADILRQQDVFGPLIFVMDAQRVAEITDLINQGKVPLNFSSGTVDSHQFFGDFRNQNIAVDVVDGLDARLQQRIPVSNGALELALSGMYLFGDERRLTPTSRSAIDIIDTPFNQSRLRARASVTWQLPAASLTLAANYVDDFESNLLVGEPANVASWSTVDLAGRMTIPGMQNVELGLSVVNLFDRDPPFMLCADITACVNYDTSKANPLGRLLAASITAKF